MKTVLITGGTKGIGLESTNIFLENNYRVVVIGRDFDNFMFRNHKNIKCIKFDVGCIDKIAGIVEEIGEIDILINNAGIMNSYKYDKYPEEKVVEILKINIEAPVTFIREVSKKMIKKGGGRIVNTASIAGEIGHPDIWYGITKAGIINATKSFAKILGEQGIVINAVAPGPVETDMFKIIPENRKSEIKKTTYLNRFAEADEIAETIFWLAVQSPKYINGTCIDINNGAFPR